MHACFKFVISSFDVRSMSEKEKKRVSGKKTDGSYWKMRITLTCSLSKIPRNRQLLLGEEFSNVYNQNIARKCVFVKHFDAHLFLKQAANIESSVAASTQNGVKFNEY